MGGTFGSCEPARLLDTIDTGEFLSLLKQKLVDVAVIDRGSFWGDAMQRYRQLFFAAVVRVVYARVRYRQPVEHVVPPFERELPKQGSMRSSIAIDESLGTPLLLRPGETG
jgi:hypothetical protein